MEEIWTRLDAHFSAVDGALADLNGPISEENSQALKARLGSRAAARLLLKSLSIHDGQKGDLFLLGTWRLTPSYQILESLKSGFFSSLFGKKKPVDSVIIADNGGNAWLELELRSGAIRDVWEDGDNVVFPDYESFLKRVLSDLDEGVLAFDNESGGYAIVGDRDAYWPTPD